MGRATTACRARCGVCFDLLTIRFLLRYMTRPLHFFGSIGALAMIAGGGLAAWLLALKLITGESLIVAHGPIFVIARGADPGGNPDAWHWTAGRATGAPLSHTRATALRMPWTGCCG